MTAKITPPTGLGKAGRALWSEIVAQARDDGLMLDARERRWLRDAAAEADQLARIETALAGADLIVVGAAGQPRVNALLAEATRSRATIAALLGRLKTDEFPTNHSANGRGSRTTSASARHAALVRHHGPDYGTGA